MSGGGGSSNLLDMGLMIAAGVAAPELAPELLDAEGGFMGLEGTSALTAAGGVAGAGLSGLAGAVTGQNVLQSAALGGLGGAAAGYMQGSSLADAAAKANAGIDPNVMNQAQTAGTNALRDASGNLPAGVQMQGGTLGTTMTPEQLGTNISRGIISPDAAAQYTQAYANGLPATVSPAIAQPFSATTGQMIAAASPAALNTLSQKPAGAYTPPNAVWNGGALSKFRYDPSSYNPDVVTPPNPHYQANYSGMAGSPYAQGGIAGLKAGGLAFAVGGNTDQTSPGIAGQKLSVPDYSSMYLDPNSNQYISNQEHQQQLEAAAAAAASQAQSAANNTSSSSGGDGGGAGAGDGGDGGGGDGGGGDAKGGYYSRGHLHYHPMASGGISNLGSYSDGGRLLKGPGDGMSDDIPAKIGGHQEARLADGEFVVPADVVSHLGNGSTDAGAKHLYKMMDKVRKARTGNPKQGKQIKADKYLPA